MKWDQLKGKIEETGGVFAMKSVEDAVDNLSSSAKDQPWKGTVLNMIGDAVEQHGWEGIKKVEDALDAVSAGENPDLSFASLAVQSDFLAIMQEEEAQAKLEMKAFLVQAGIIIGTILKAVLKAIL